MATDQQASENAQKIYDLIIIGGGPAGYVGAIRASQLGMKVACIEKRKTLGGTCLNIGCIPSKALLDATDHFHQAKDSFHAFGIMFKDISYDLEGIMGHKHQVVRGLTDGIDFLFKKNKVTRFLGNGRIASQVSDGWAVEIQNDGEKKSISGRRILLAMGSEVIELPFLKYDGTHVISSTEALSLSRVPEHLIVVGGGYIGLEMASVWSRLGTKITIIEAQARILSQSDEASAKELEKALSKQGFQFRYHAFCKGARVENDKVKVTVEENGQQQEIIGDHVLVAVGRRPLTESAGIREVGVRLDEKNRVIVDSNYMTNVSGIYAVGDLIAGPMLAHKASEEASVAVERMCGFQGHVNYEAIPSVIYTSPEYASVGAAEHELTARGISFKVGSFPFSANARARSLRESEGFARILSDAVSDRVLGVHIVGPRASEMIPAAVTVIEFGGSSEDLARTCFAHPTLPEVMKEAALDIEKRRIHL